MVYPTFIVQRIESSMDYANGIYVAVNMPCIHNVIRVLEIV